MWDRYNINHSVHVHFFFFLTFHGTKTTTDFSNNLHKKNLAEMTFSFLLSHLTFTTFSGATVLLSVECVVIVYVIILLSRPCQLE